MLFAEYPGSSPNTHVVAHIFNSSSKGSDSLLWPLWPTGKHVVHIRAGKTFKHIKLKKKKKTQLRHLAIVDRVSELTIYCNRIGDYPNCHYRAFTQELIKSGTEIHSQTLVWTLGVILKKGRKDYMEPGEVKVMTEEPETADLSLWEHMDSGPTVRELALDWPRSSACV